MASRIDIGSGPSEPALPLPPVPVPVPLSLMPASLIIGSSGIGTPGIAARPGSSGGASHAPSSLPPQSPFTT